MAAPPSLNKQGTDEYWNGGLVLTDAKRSNSLRLVNYSTDLMALPEKIDYMDFINSNPEETRPTIPLEDERKNGVMKSLGIKVRMSGQADDIESVDVDEKGGSIKQIKDWNPEATSASDTGYMLSEGNLTYYDDVRAELGLFVDHTAVELGIMMNLIDWDSMAAMYSDGVQYGYSETVYGSLWETDIWQLN